MINDYFDTLTNKLSNLVEEFEALEKKIKDLQDQEQRLTARAVELNDQTLKLNNLDADVRRRESKLTILRDEARTANKEADYKKARLEEMTVKVREERKEVDEKLELLDRLKAKEASLKQIEADLALKDQDLKDREFMLAKEKTIDRERKLQLDRRESNLEAEKERIQRIAER